MIEAPSTDVIRHWVAWGYSPDCPDEFIDHDALRIEQFEAWFAEAKAEAVAGTLAKVRAEERRRAIEIIERKTYHYGKTHSANTKCTICDIYLEIESEA